MLKQLLLVSYKRLKPMLLNFRIRQTINKSSDGRCFRGKVTATNQNFIIYCPRVQRAGFNPQGEQNRYELLDPRFRQIVESHLPQNNWTFVIASIQFKQRGMCFVVGNPIPFSFPPS
jgi:hypothetical protein